MRQAIRSTPQVGHSSREAPDMSADGSQVERGGIASAGGKTDPARGEQRPECHTSPPTPHVVVELCPGRQTSSRFSTMVTSESIRITNSARINMPENTPVTSNTLSAS